MELAPRCSFVPPNLGVMPRAALGAGRRRVRDCSISSEPLELLGAGCPKLKALTSKMLKWIGMLYPLYWMLKLANEAKASGLVLKSQSAHCVLAVALGCPK